MLYFTFFGFWVKELLIDNLFVGPHELMIGPTKTGKLHNVTTHKVIWANQKTETFVYCWLLLYMLWLM